MDDKTEEIADSLKGIKPQVYEFRWGHHFDEVFLMEIWADEDIVETLLNQYKRSDEEYNADGWLDFLKSKGIRSRFIELNHTLRF